jgi:TonB family protein
MPAVQKLRSGILELRTNAGLVYVTPSFRQRLYLLWTFRNFHRLPLEVLNRHQKQLINSLSQTASIAGKSSVATTFLIGSVENVYLAPQRNTEAAAITSKLLKMSAQVTDGVSAHAVGAEGVSISRRRAKTQIPGIHSRGQRTGIESISSSKLFSSAQRQGEKQVAAPIVSDTHKGLARNWFAGSLVAGSSVVLLAMLIYLHNKWVVPGNVASRPVVQIWDTRRERPTGIEQPQTPGQSMGTQKSSRIHLPLQEPAAASSPQDERNQLSKVTVASVPTSIPDSTPSQRFLVTEPPKSGFRYPVAPNASLTGKVTLRMMIGVDGSVTRIDVLSGNHALALAAVRAVHHWRYAPHEVIGNSAEAETSVVINFVGDEAVSVSFPGPGQSR